MYFFQEAFTDAKVINGRIILNNKGDYTTSPETILDKNKKVIYKGIVFDKEMFGLIANATTGMMLVPESFSSLLEQEDEKGIQNLTMIFYGKKEDLYK